MPSTYKTNYLGLNRFVGTDHPKMEDVNFDNQTIDTKFQEHIQSQLHITEEERQQLGKAGVLVGSYVGDGSSSRTIELGGTVEFGIVFAAGEPMVVPASSGPLNLYAAMMSSLGCSKGVALETNGFRVTNHTSNPPDGKKCQLNQSEKTYLYGVFLKKG